MTKKRISVTVDENTDRFLDSLLKDGRYRNKSHAVEEIIRSFKGEKNDKGK